MNDYGFLVGSYFIGFAILIAALSLITVWSGRKIWVRAGAVGLSLVAIYLSFLVVDDLLSRPKPVTLAELQSQIPDGHPGHLVLYGEVAEEGIYLLLRSPANIEPRYYLLVSKDKKQAEKLKEGFEEAQRIAKKMGTQLLLGGKSKEKGASGNGKKGKGKEGRGRGEENVEMDAIFHPLPVSGGPEKDMTTPDRPVTVPTPNRGGDTGGGADL